MGPMLAPWILLSGMLLVNLCYEIPTLFVKQSHIPNRCLKSKLDYSSQRHLSADDLLDAPRTGQPLQSHVITSRDSFGVFEYSYFLSSIRAYSLRNFIKTLRPMVPFSYFRRFRVVIEQQFFLLPKWYNIVAKQTLCSRYGNISTCGN